MTAGTGDGTDHDATYIRPRPAFAFEQMWDSDRGVEGQRGLGRKMRRRLARWFGLEVVRHDVAHVATLSGPMHRKSEQVDTLMVDLTRGTAGWELARSRSATENA